MTTATPRHTQQKPDDRDPGWIRVGNAIKQDRQRRSMTREHLAERAARTGSHLTPRTVALVEQGRVECRGGASPELARRAYLALGWTQDLYRRIKVDAEPLPPLPDRNAPRDVPYPAATLTGRLHSARGDQLMRLHAQFTDKAAEVRTTLIRLGHGLTDLNSDSVAHHAAATRAARQLMNRWMEELFAELEDSEYTNPEPEK